MKKTILISGIHGFLGSAFAGYLQQKHKDLRTVGISRRRSYQSEDIYKCDLNDHKSLKVVLNKIKPDVIFHFAGGRLANDQMTYDANFTTTRCLLESIQELKLFKTRVIVPGSAAEYGNIQDQKLIREDCLPKPLSWYGYIKLMQTALGLYYARQGLNVSVVRMFNICGNLTPSHLAIGGFAKQIIAIERGAKPVIHTKNLQGKRDFLDIEDICRGLWMIAKKGKSGEIYNLCSGKPSSIRDLLQTMLVYSSVKGIIVKENKKDASLSFDAIGSNDKLCALTRWQPQVSLENSLKNTLASYRQISDL